MLILCVWVKHHDNEHYKKHETILMYVNIGKSERIIKTRFGVDSVGTWVMG